MTAGAHDAVTLGCYALGVLDAHESLGVEQHLRGLSGLPCAGRRLPSDPHGARRRCPVRRFFTSSRTTCPCRRTCCCSARCGRSGTSRSFRSSGRPTNAREPVHVPVEELPEPQHAKPRRWPAYLAAAAVAAVVAFGGVLRCSCRTRRRALATRRPLTGEATAAGGIKLVAEIARPPRTGTWSRPRSTALPAAQKCKLVVIGKDGSKTEAHGWTSTEKGRVDGVRPCEAWSASRRTR